MADAATQPDCASLRERHGGGAGDAVTFRSDDPNAPLEADELIDQRIDHVFFRPGQPNLRVAVERVSLLGDSVDSPAAPSLSLEPGRLLS